MRKILNVCLLMQLFIVTGCAGPGKVMDTWIGRTQEQLIKTLGPASRVIDNGKAGQILMYAASVDVRVAPPAISVTTSQGDGYTRQEAAPAQESKPYLKVKMFYINPAGVIYAWKMENV